MNKKEKQQIITPESEIQQLKNELERFNDGFVCNPIWEVNKFEVKEKKCFVLMPFSETNDVQSVYKNHVKKILEKNFGYQCNRADDIFNIGEIMKQIWIEINEAQLIIAEMTGCNPNVLYELGIAHTIGKKVIMITQSLDYVPFDLRHLRTILYEYKPHKIDEFEYNLASMVMAVTVKHSHEWRMFTKDNLCVLKLHKSIDIPRAEKFARKLEEIFKIGITNIVVDISDIDIGSSGIGKLLLFDKIAKNEKFNFNVYLGYNEKTKSLFKTIKFDKLFKQDFSPQLIKLIIEATGALQGDIQETTQKNK
jgi:anti-anti-sigma factor